MAIKNLTVIGAGPGGYAAAFLAADMGMNVTLIDKEKNPGGVCLYRGCIPSKALLHIAKLLNETKEARKWGINFGEPEIDVKRVRAFKNKVVAKLTGGTGMLVRQRKINYIQGTASFVNSGSVKVEKSDGSAETINFDKAIVAAGSVPAVIPGVDSSSPNIIDSTGALELNDVPEKMLVIGGGYIGLEMGSVYAALGSKITVVEMLPFLLPGADRDLVNVLAKSLKPRFENIFLNTKVAEIKDIGEKVEVRLEGEGIKEPELEFDKVLISIGRKPVTKGLGIENTSVEISDRGFVVVDETLRTSDENIYAIGDIVGGAMLAHKASAEGKVAVEAIAGEKVAFEPAAIPGVVFTDPELAWAGLTETEAEEKKMDVEILKFPWGASGRAVTLDRNDGLTKLIVDKDNGRVLGVGIVGPGAGEMIAEGTLAIEMAAVAKDLALTIHAHPTLSETIMESAEMFFGQATHLYKPGK